MDDLSKLEIESLHQQLPELPHDMIKSLERHRANLVNLVDRLKAVGMDEASIASHISEMMEDYRHDLTAAVNLYAGGSRD